MDLLKQHAGIDIRAMYPAGAAPKADAWTTDAFLKAAEACHKGGVPFGIGFGTTSDSVDTAGSFFHAFGANLVDAKGNIVVKSDETKQVLEYLKKLISFLPADVPAWDDASNNKWLVSGKGAMIMNPPSAWAVAKRDAPQIAEQLWTHGFPVGPKGRFAPFLPFYWGIWNFGKNKSAAKNLLRHLSTRQAVAKMVEGSGGYDLPAFANLTTLPTWAEVGPPKGTIYHYPNPHNHQILSIGAAPAPPRIANQIYNSGLMTKMAVRHAQGETVDRTIAWAAKELEGFMRV
jgi:ABC-type glycerol-3-phosphate transport system substrate-binding protein